MIYYGISRLYVTVPCWFLFSSWMTNEGILEGVTNQWLLSTDECYAIGSCYFWNACKAFFVRQWFSCVGVGENCRVHTGCSCGGLLIRGDEEIPVWLVLGLPKGKTASFGVSDFLLSFLLSVICSWQTCTAEAGSWPACPGCVIPVECVLASAGRCWAYPAVPSPLCLG